MRNVKDRDSVRMWSVMVTALQTMLLVTPTKEEVAGYNRRSRYARMRERMVSSARAGLTSCIT